jgi:ELWxxDGT repeat protein
LSGSATSAHASAQLNVFDSSVIDINPGSASSNPEEQGFKLLGSHLYFVADDGVHGRELWRTDGVTAELVEDINPGPSGSEIYLWGAKSYGQKLYFSANDGVHGNEPWWTDGVTTEMLMDTRPGIDSGGFATSFTEHLGWLYFDADNGATRQLWRTDGASTEAFLGLSADNRLGIWCRSLKLQLFCSQMPTLYRINEDSSLDGVGTIGDWWPTNLNSTTWLIPGRNMLSVFDGSTMRQLSQGPGLRYQPDGYPPATFKGKVYVGSNIGLLRMSGMALERFGTQLPSGAGGEFIELGGWLYFIGADGVRGNEVWRTNGTLIRLVGELNTRTTGGEHVRGINWKPQSVAGGYLYFVAQFNPVTGESGLFRTNGVKIDRVKYGNAQLDCKLCSFWGASEIGSKRVGSARTQSAGNELGIVDLTKISTDRRAAPKVKPSISGTARVGEVLTAGVGRWDGHPRVSTAVQWYACGLSVAVPRTTLPTGCKKVSGATNPTLLITQALRGKYLLVAVTAKSARTAATVWTSKTTVKVP